MKDFYQTCLIKKKLEQSMVRRFDRCYTCPCIHIHVRKVRYVQYTISWLTRNPQLGWLLKSPARFLVVALSSLLRAPIPEYHSGTGLFSVFRLRVRRDPVVRGFDRRHGPRTHNRQVGYTSDRGDIVIPLCPQI